MARHVLQQHVVAAAQFAQKPVVRFASQWGRATEEQGLEQGGSVGVQCALFICIAIELGYPFEQVPQEEQAFRVDVGVRGGVSVGVGVGDAGARVGVIAAVDAIGGRVGAA